LHNSQVLWKSDDDHPEQQLELEQDSIVVVELEPDFVLVLGTMVLRSLCASCSVDEEQGLCPVLPCQLLYRVLKLLNK
jgi:hypothetical protein